HLREAKLLLLVAPLCSLVVVGGPARPRRRTPPPAQAAPPSTPSGTVDFHFFKTKLDPIIFKMRTGHTRCYGCHILPNRAFQLATLQAGSTDWIDEQSQSNFQSALDQVEPGEPLSSRLLIHPLAPEAGGDPFHSGGRQFESQNDPDWLTIAAWVRGAGA